MKSNITNVSDSSISLFAKVNDVEQKVEIPAGGELIVDTYETKTIRVFKKRGFITMEAVKNVAQLNENVEVVENKSSTIDNFVDPNNEVITEDPTRFDIIEGEVEQYVENGYIKGTWTDDDVAFLKKNYPKKGRKFCSTELNRNESSVQKKINSLNLKKKKKKKNKKK